MLGVYNYGHTVRNGCVNMNDLSIRFLYGTLPGRGILRLLLDNRADRLLVRFLQSRWSRPIIPWYAWRNGVRLEKRELRRYRSFRDFFGRQRGGASIDYTPEHLISPCDGWLRGYTIEADGGFTIKGVRYRLQDLLNDPPLAQRYIGGTCLIFRIGASDYHHYCYFDDAYLWQNHFIPGTLHSVQPVASETYPVYTLNRRCWCLMTTRSFGPVVQAEIGAFAVGRIVNYQENTRVCRGEEKGHFELAGSSIVLLFEANRIYLISGIRQETEAGRELRVRQGMWLGGQIRAEKTAREKRDAEEKPCRETR